MTTENRNNTKYLNPHMLNTKFTTEFVEIKVSAKIHEYYSRDVRKVTD